MANLAEPSSSISITSSSYLSNGSSAPPSTGQSTNLEIVSLSRLSSNLERLLLDSDFDCTDADIVVEGVSVGIHRCILAARSKIFREIFAKGEKNEGKKAKYWLNELLPDGGRVGREAFSVFLGYLYTGRLKQSPPEVSTCVDPSCAHDACRPAVNFAVELMYASSVFQIPELVSLFQV